jgi:hypothetical protein
MKSTDIEFITAAAGLVGETIRKGFDFPVYLVAVGSNGSVVVERVEGAGEQWTLTEHYEGSTLEPPINLFAVDCKGRHLHSVIGGELVPKPVTYPRSDQTH